MALNLDRKSQLLAGFVVLLAAGCAAPRQTASRAESPPAPYVRAAHDPDGTTKLEVAVRSLTPARGRGATLWLVGVTHLGTAEYYGQIQRFLDAQALVLFEGVGATNKSFARPRGADFNLQAALAKALGLEFQLHTIDYNRPHFQNSDLTVAELSRILSDATPRDAPDPGGQAAPSEERGATELDALLDAMQGSGFLGALARITVAVLEASPRLQAATRVLLVEVLSGLPNDLPQMPGLPSGFQNLLRVLIEERNLKVVEDVRRAVQTKPRPRSIAIFYGAGHMTDLETRLRRALGYQPGEERWLTALAVSPQQAGLSEWELNLVRAWVRHQLAR